MAEDSLTGEELPPIPTFMIDRTLKLRDRLYELACFNAKHNVVAGDVFHALVSVVHKQLPQGIPLAAVRETALVLLGQELTPALALDFCWRVAGNVETLRTGRAVYPWGGSNDRTWAPMEVLEVNRDVSASGQVRTLSRLRVLAGPACPTIVTKSWTDPHLRFLASELGFERYRPDRPCRTFDKPAQVVGLRFVGLLEPVRRGEPPTARFRVVKVTSSLLEFNRKRIAARAVKPCQFGYKHDCHLCVVGYDACDLATHPMSFVRGRCPTCDNDDALFDPARPDLCVACHEAEVRRARPRRT